MTLKGRMLTRISDQKPILRGRNQIERNQMENPVGYYHLKVTQLRGTVSNYACVYINSSTQLLLQKTTLGERPPHRKDENTRVFESSIFTTNIGALGFNIPDTLLMILSLNGWGWGCVETC